MMYNAHVDFYRSNAIYSVRMVSSSVCYRGNEAYPSCHISLPHLHPQMIWNESLTYWGGRSEKYLKKKKNHCAALRTSYEINCRDFTALKMFEIAEIEEQCNKWCKNSAKTLIFNMSLYLITTVAVMLQQCSCKIMLAKKSQIEFQK